MSIIVAVMYPARSEERKQIRFAPLWRPASEQAERVEQALLILGSTLREVVEFGGDHAGRVGVDGDVPWPQFSGEDTGEV
jgi:hypothetical protein